MFHLNFNFEEVFNFLITILIEFRRLEFQNSCSGFLFKLWLNRLSLNGFFGFTFFYFFFFLFFLFFFFFRDSFLIVSFFQRVLSDFSNTVNTKFNSDFLFEFFFFDFSWIQIINSQKSIISSGVLTIL